MNVFKNHTYGPRRAGRRIRTCVRCGVQNRTLPNGTRQWRHRVAGLDHWLHGQWQTTNITCMVLEGPKQQPKTPTIEDRIARLEAEVLQLRDDMFALGGPWRSP